LRASIVIPTLNRPALLLQTLQSLETQSVPADSYEVIVGIDGSPEGIVEALSRLRPPYLLRWTVTKNRGSGAARNAGARLASHDVLIFLDDDQLAWTDLVAAHLDAHERYGTVLVQGDYPTAPHLPRSGTAIVYERSRQSTMDRIRRSAPQTWHIWGGNISVRRSTWTQLGGYDESFRRKQDTDFGLRIAALAIPFIFEPRARSSHLYGCAYAAFRQQTLEEGRALVRLARKHALPLQTFSGGALGLRDHALIKGWRVAPAAMRVLGWLLTAGLRASDRLNLAAAQLHAARGVRRLYLLAGMAEQQQARSRVAVVIQEVQPGWRLP
jgi:GT2 family glycosyltransferase